MNTFTCNRILLSDPCGTRVRMAIAERGEVVEEILTSEPAMESFAESASQICFRCGIRITDIESFGIAQGPGSMLGVRIASAYLSTIAKSFDRDIFVWDCLETSIYALAEKYSLLDLECAAPSRKGFLNLAVLRGGRLVSEEEIEIEKAEELFSPHTFALKQRPCPILEKLPAADISLAETLKVIKIKDIALKSELPPDAKSLSKREYVKWKDQAHI